MAPARRTTGARAVSVIQGFPRGPKPSLHPFLYLPSAAAMSIDLVQELNQLTAGFGSVPATLAAADRLCSDAGALFEVVARDEAAVQRADSTRLARCARLQTQGRSLRHALRATSLSCLPASKYHCACSAMAAPARQLAALYNASGSGRTWRDSLPAARQLEAICIALRTCGHVASMRALRRSNALQLASAAKRVFRGGQAALAGHIARWRACQ